MLNYRRHRSYNNGAPNSCAVTVFGIGVVLTLGGIVLLVITRNTRHKDEQIIEKGDDKQSPHYNDNSLNQQKHKSTQADNTLKTLGPIVLGLGITIIVLFFFVITAVAWKRGLKASATTQFPMTVNRSTNMVSARGQEDSCDSAQPSGVVDSPNSPKEEQTVPNSQSGYCLHSTAGLHGPLLLERPPSYDETFTQQGNEESSKQYNEHLIPLKSV